MSREDAARCGPDFLARYDELVAKATTYDELPGAGKVPGRTPKRSKYRNVITTYNGVKYSSKAEAVRAEVLDHEQRSGVIRFWVGQPKFRLGCPENIYIADFIVIGITSVHVEDVKGVPTAKFLRDVRLWRRYGPCELHILKRGKVAEIITPEGSEP